MPRRSTPIPTTTASRPARGESRQGAATTTALAYLAQVCEKRPPLSEHSPIWMRHGRVSSGLASPTPEQHPCCEFGIGLSGRGVELVGAERIVRGPGDVFIAGPGLPHWIEITEYPMDFITVFFLPSLLIEAGPEGDGLRVLQRFATARSARERIIHAPADITRALEDGFRQMAHEWDHPGFGRELRLRTLLLDMLVKLMRWEDQLASRSDAPPTDIKGQPAELASESSWRAVHRALQYLRDHFADLIYADDVAAAAGLTRTQLQRAFRATLGVSWGQYLQSYRIHQAATLLSSTECGVLDAALAVGFETPSHFNATFRSVMGVSPREYRRNRTTDTGGLNGAEKTH